MLGTAVGCCELGGQEIAAEVVPLSQSRRQRSYVCLQSSTLAFEGDGGGLLPPCRGNGTTPSPQILIKFL